MPNVVSNLSSTATNALGTTTPISTADLVVLNTKFATLTTDSHSNKFEDNFSNKDHKIAAFKFDFGAMKKELKQELKSQYSKLSDADADKLADKMVDVLKGFDDHFQAFAALGVGPGRLDDNFIGKLIESFFAKKTTENQLPLPRTDMTNAAREIFNTLDEKLIGIFNSSSDPLMKSLADMLATNNKKISYCDAAKIYGRIKNHLDADIRDNPKLLRGMCNYLIDHPNMSNDKLQSFIEVANQFAASDQLSQLFEVKGLRPYEAMAVLDCLSDLRDNNPNKYNAAVKFLSDNPAAFKSLNQFTTSTINSAVLNSWLNHCANAVNAANDPARDQTVQAKQSNNDAQALSVDISSMTASGRSADELPEEVTESTSTTQETKVLEIRKQDHKELQIKNHGDPLKPSTAKQQQL